MENNNQNTNLDLGSEIEVRKQKIADLKANGVIPYVDGFKTTHTISEARALADGQKVTTAGRVVFKRVMGKLSFIQIYDIFGKIQVSVGRNELEEEAYTFFKKQIDIADFVGVEGEMYTTHTGERTIRTSKITLLSKAMRPLPEKFHGLTDTDSKYRQRYLDVITNEDSRRIAVGRTKIISYIRHFLEDRGFIEVETPILQSAVSGASAKPFFTKHNALDKICNLRIAPETYLKQVVAAGFPRVFEFAKSFRNEGMDTQHLQEFTLLEWYASYWNYEDNIRLFTDLIHGILNDIVGSTKIVIEDKEIDFAGEFEQVDYTKHLSKLVGFDILKFDTRDEFVNEVVKRGILERDEFNDVKTLGGAIDLVYKRKWRGEIVKPTILFNYPNLTPLCRERDDNHKVLEKFQLVANGAEMCNAYSELIDPIVQREKLEEQARAKAAGDEEANDLDEDFLLCMEHGMPPMSGLGMGIDRLVQLIYNAPSIRDVVLFPLMK